MHAHRSARLLLAEDNPINREVALQLLHGSGLHVDTAEDGCEAVRMAQEQPLRPGADGRADAGTGRPAGHARHSQLPGWADVPILAMTANAFDDDRRPAKRRA
jgi:two-component system sensor histidine kinase/response regulator